MENERKWTMAGWSDSKKIWLENYQSSYDYSAHEDDAADLLNFDNGDRWIAEESRYESDTKTLSIGVKSVVRSHWQEKTCRRKG